MFYSVSADILSILHFFYVAFVVVGEAVILIGLVFRWGWVRNPWFRYLHLAAIGYVALEAIFHIRCPLTVWEYDLRELAGQDPGEETYVERLVHFLFMDSGSADERWPEWVYEALHIGFGVLVFLTFVLFPPRFRRAKAATTPATPAVDPAQAPS